MKIENVINHLIMRLAVVQKCTMEVLMTLVIRHFRCLLSTTAIYHQSLGQKQWKQKYLLNSPVLINRGYKVLTGAHQKRGLLLHFGRSNIDLLHYTFAKAEGADASQ